MLKKSILEITVFMCGGVVMIYEIVGSRLLAPYFGTSTFVWTSIIGVILGSLSFGYYIGGILADRKATHRILSYIVFLAGISITLTITLEEFLLTLLQLNVDDIRVASLLASVFLFFPASFFLGMVSPYTAKLKMRSLKSTGRTMGNLYALSTLGCITGTFLAGFIIIPILGTDRILILLIAVLTLLSILIYFSKDLKVKLIVLGITVLSVVFGNLGLVPGGSSVIDIDTQYSRVWIYNRVDASTGREVKVMGINNENHSSMFLDSDELVNEYTKYYHLISHFSPDFERVLMIGGAGYSFPKSFIKEYPNSIIDVLEIDPKVTDLARVYFRLKDNPNMNIYHMDGRVYLNRTEIKYDAVLGDAFGSRHSVPYHLTTLEAVTSMHSVLNDNGVVILNIISSLEGDRGKFLQAQYLTYKEVFPRVYIFQVDKGRDSTELQNLILVAIKSEEVPSMTSGIDSIQRMLSMQWKGELTSSVPILTDDFAPVEYYVNSGNW